MIECVFFAFDEIFRNKAWRFWDSTWESTESQPVAINKKELVSLAESNFNLQLQLETFCGKINQLQPFLHNF